MLIGVFLHVEKPPKKSFKPAVCTLSHHELFCLIYLPSPPHPLQLPLTPPLSPTPSHPLPTLSNSVTSSLSPPPTAPSHRPLSPQVIVSNHVSVLDRLLVECCMPCYTVRRGHSQPFKVFLTLRARERSAAFTSTGCVYLCLPVRTCPPAVFTCPDMSSLSLLPEFMFTT